MLASPRPRPSNLDLNHDSGQSRHSWSFFTEESMAPCFSTFQIQICESIGSGGFGTVYCGWLDKQRIAVKKFKMNSKTEDLAWSSYLAELQMMRFNHPNIVKVLGSMMYENTPCLVLEYAGSKNLQQIIDCKDEKLSLARRVDIACNIACGMEYIHNLDIVHLDIKPANVIVNEKSLCKIADFGCSLKIGDSGGAARPSFYLTGTHAYKAPELLLGEFPTSQADVYSVGVCMWQMLSRIEPYAGEDPQLVIFGIATHCVRPHLPTVLPESDVEYQRLFEKCWAGAPRERPTATILKQELRMHRELS